MRAADELGISYVVHAVVLVGSFLLALLDFVHPDALMGPTLAANTAVDICGIRAVLQGDQLGPHNLTHQRNANGRDADLQESRRD